MINYYLLTKPGIILGNLITFAAGYLLASKGNINLSLFFITLIALAFIIASACVFNNYIDRPIDKIMSRTKKRPLAAGLVSGNYALAFGTVLLLIGNAIFLLSSTYLSLALADIGFLIYVVLYSLWKRKTIYATAIGSIAGAIPPVVGYCAVSNRLDAGAFILFLIMVLWQMPHFFAIAMYHLKDYTAANIPSLPIYRGAYITKIRMVIYILAFTLTAALLTAFNYTGYLYLAIALIMGAAWLALCLAGFRSNNDTLWGRRMFQLSLVVITAWSIMIPLDLVQ